MSFTIPSLFLIAPLQYHPYSLLLLYSTILIPYCSFTMPSLFLIAPLQYHPYFLLLLYNTILIPYCSFGAAAHYSAVIRIRMIPIILRCAL